MGSAAGSMRSGSMVGSGSCSTEGAVGGGEVTTLGLGGSVCDGVGAGGGAKGAGLGVGVGAGGSGGCPIRAGSLNMGPTGPEVGGPAGEV
jgi:hypothetical protein